MIKFPETAESEWRIVADAVQASRALRQRIERDSKVEYEVERLRVRHEAQQAFQQELDAANTPALEMITLFDYQNTPALAPVDLIDGVMKDNGTMVMLGPSASGKSTLALQTLHSLLTGEDWLGQTATRIDGTVGLMSYDMDSSMLLDWMSGWPNVDKSRVSVVNAHKRGNPLGVPAIRSQIVDAWTKANVEVVVIDSFSASFFGHDQNDAALTQNHYRDLQRFALTEIGAKVLIVIVHSTDGNPRKARGSSVHKDVADTMLVVEVDPATGSRRVDVEKYRAAMGQAPMTPVMITAPDSVTHLVQLDIGAMNLAGLRLPASAGAQMFPDPALANDIPDVSTYDDEEDEL